MEPALTRPRHEVIDYRDRLVHRGCPAPLALEIVR